MPRLLGIAKALTGSKYCGKAADCWSVGATLFTMLAGFSPSNDDEAEVRVGRRGDGGNKSEGMDLRERGG